MKIRLDQVVVDALDPQLLVPNPTLTLHEGAIPYWGELRKKRDSWAYRCLVSIEA